MKLTSPCLRTKAVIEFVYTYSCWLHRKLILFGHGIALSCLAQGETSPCTDVGGEVVVYEKCENAQAAP